MLQPELNQVTGAEPPDSRWNWLYRLGGAGALLTVGLIPMKEWANKGGFWNEARARW
jgi:hypothetical protein